MMWLLVGAALAADPPPSMVTLATGAVTVVQGKTRTVAPAAPFLLASGQTLDLAAGAHVVILRSGGAFSADGPRVVDAKALAPATATPDEVGSLLSNRTSLASAGAARAAGLTLTRPVPNTPAYAIADVRWVCDGCGPQPVEVRDLRADTSVWTGKGDGAVRYDGPALAPGVYLVRVGGNEFSVRVSPADEEQALLGGLQGIPDPADRAASEAGALLLAGHPTDALARLEAAGLTGLVAATEKLAGVGK
jgi:hypothetical protein